MVTEEFSVFELIRRINDCCAVLLAGLKKLNVESPLASGITSELRLVKKPSGVRIKLCADRSSEEAIVNLHLPLPSPSFPSIPLAVFPFSRS